MRHRAGWVALFVLNVSFSVVSEAQALTVFAAASLKDVLTELGSDYARSGGVQVTFSFAGSSMLARQIEYGAPADVFISANVAWMDELEKNDLLEPGTRADLTGNRLVLIAPDSSGSPRVEWSNPSALVDRMKQGRIAMALVDAVPAGIYGKMALQSGGHWSQVKSLVVQTDNVRSALALVSKGEASLGIVYASDLHSANVAVVTEFPQTAHAPIVYPMAVIAGTPDPSAARGFQAFLMTDAAQDTFARHGFSSPDRP